jgi:restriction system protein
VLIDGEQLAKYIYDYSLGMQTKEIIEIKELDSDFWDSMEDDNTI